MDAKEIMAQLKALGDENIKKVLLKHGVKEPFFGVKIEYLKPIQKKIKMDYALANELYFTNNADAMYLAGLIADDEKMSKKGIIQSGNSKYDLYRCNECGHEEMKAISVNERYHR